MPPATATEFDDLLKLAVIEARDTTHQYESVPVSQKWLKYVEMIHKNNKRATLPVANEEEADRLKLTILSAVRKYSESGDTGESVPLRAVCKTAEVEFPARDKDGKPLMQDGKPIFEARLALRFTVSKASTGRKRKNKTSLTTTDVPPAA